MASMSLAVLVLALHHLQLNGESISCNGVDPCICDPIKNGETCILDCTARQAVCQHSVLKCRDGDPCVINCSKRRACQDSHITCPSNSDCTINCITPGDVCDGNSGGEFNVTLNEAKTYKCIHGEAPNKGVCPNISQAGVPAPFTASPTRAPTMYTSAPTTSVPTISPLTSDPTTNEPTLSPVTEAPTSTPTIITDEPTISPITQAPSSNPSQSPSFSPSATAQPSNTPLLITTTSSLNTNQLTSSTSSATIFTSTLPLSTAHPTTSNPAVTTSIPTVAPSIIHYTIDTTHPTTEIPSVSVSTFYPTSYCLDWEITLVFILAHYPQNDHMKTQLQHVILNAFHNTILLQFNGTWHDYDWCVNIEINITLLADRRKRLLEDNADIAIRSTFTFNDVLHDDYFDAYDINEFGVEFRSVLMAAMGLNVDAFTVVSNPIQVTDTTASPTYPPHELQTRHAHHGRETLIVVMCSIFGGCCLIVCIFSCYKWYKHEIAYEKQYNEHCYRHRKYLQVAPSTPSVTINTAAGAAPVTPVVEIETIEEEKKQTETKTARGEHKINVNINVTKKKKMATLSPEAGQKNTRHSEQTSFELHLVDQLVKEDSLMGHIINDINLQYKETRL